MISALLSALLLTRRRGVGRWVSALLAAHWAWSARAYHAVFFTHQPGRMDLRVVVPRPSLIAYSLAYPAINAIDHHSLSTIPTFGLPCPTTIFTAGMLMLVTPRSWVLSRHP